MARGKGSKSSKKIARTKTAKAKQRKLLAHEKKLSKKLGYSVTYARHKRERKASRKFITTAKKYAPFSPEMKTLSKKTRLTNAEKAQITKLNKKARHFLPHLVPFSKVSGTKKQKRVLKGLEPIKGLNGLSLRLTSSDATVKTDGKDIVVTSNGRTWIYWRLDKTTVRNKRGELDEAARKAFKAQFPIELIAQLADKAFKQLKVQAVSLWTTAGRTDSTQASITQFLRYLHSKMQAGRYMSTRENADGSEYETPSDAGDFILGLAILLEEPKKSRNKK